ncbi:MAG TPA: hypothetical protein VGD88_12470 [Opitutaceae bacterium]
MNSIKSTLLLTGMVALSGVALAKQPKAPAAPAALQLQVDLPFVHDLFVEEDLSEALSATVRETFRRNGYQGGIDEVAVGSKPSADRPVLTVKLINWRGSRAGFVDCVFSATLTKPDGATQSLGVFTGSETNMGSFSRWDVAQTFVDAAEEASRALWRSMDKQALLPAAIPASAPASTPAPDKSAPAKAATTAVVVE